jgi:predicted transcriptional regulator
MRLGGFTVPVFLFVRGMIRLDGEKAVMKKRSWSTISIDILESGLTPLSKTRLMYKSHLNFRRFNEYFNDFLRKRLLVEAENSSGRAKLYVISKRGKVLLAALKEAQKIFDEP